MEIVTQRDHSIGSRLRYCKGEYQSRKIGTIRNMKKIMIATLSPFFISGRSTNKLYDRFSASSGTESMAY